MPKLNAPSLSPRENELVRREIQEIRDALEALGRNLRLPTAVPQQPWHMADNTDWPFIGEEVAA